MRYTRRRAKRGPNPDSYIRRRAATLLSARLGWEVFPEQIFPVQGRYRSDPMADVYRWELFTADDNGQPHVYSCWETLTLFVKRAPKNGINIDRDNEIDTGSPV